MRLTMGSIGWPASGHHRATRATDPPPRGGFWRRAGDVLRLTYRCIFAIAASKIVGVYRHRIFAGVSGLSPHTVSGIPSDHRVQVLRLDGYVVPGKSHYVYPEQQDSHAEPYALKGIGRLTVSDNTAIWVLATQQMRGKQ
jgi:hypothetical protein